MNIIMPDLGEGVTEGEIARWLVNAGDEIKEDQVVLEVMTDKATVEIPATGSGKISDLKFKEGDMVDVGAVLLILGGEAGAREAPVAPAAAPAPASASNGATATTASASSTMQKSAIASGSTALIAPANVQAAPAVRKIAREKGIDLTQVQGSGPKGRILLSDVENFSGSPVAASSSAPSTTAIAPQVSGGSMETKAPAYQPGPIMPAIGDKPREERVAVRGVRKSIVKKMAESKRTAAHFTCVEEIDVTELVEFRNSIKEETKAQGVNVTYMPFIAKACVYALRKLPALNSSLIEHEDGSSEIVYKNYFNLGIAVDTEDGLTVPVVKDVDRKNFLHVAADINDVGLRARQRKLTPNDFGDGTFTISNAGKVGGLFATPIINYPEVGILGVHEIRKRPMVVNDEIKIRDIMYLSISLDHRVADGAHGIHFLNEVAQYLSNPKKFLLEMY